MIRMTMIAVLAVATLSLAQAPDESAVLPKTVDKHLPLELGGFFTYDLAGPAEDWKKVNVPLALSWMELSARVPVADNLEGAITILSEDGPTDLKIWQCLASWEVGGTNVVVGQQNFHHGLLATRIVSGPLIWDSAWLNAPGAEVSRKLDAWTVGAGAAIRTVPEDSASGMEERNDLTGSGFLDWTPAEGSIVRLSGAGGEHFQDADLAANLSLGSFLLDLEGYRKFREKDPDLLGYSMGLAYQSGAWTVGTRYDRISLDDNVSWEGNASVGVVAQFWEAMFAGLEVMRTDDGDVGIDFQIGLSSHMKVPGFTPQQPGR